MKISGPIEATFKGCPIQIDLSGSLFSYLHLCWRDDLAIRVKN
jgi:hypothetical protein